MDIGFLEKRLNSMAFIQRFEYALEEVRPV